MYLYALFLCISSAVGKVSSLYWLVPYLLQVVSEEDKLIYQEVLINYQPIMCVKFKIHVCNVTACRLFIWEVCVI